MIYRWLRNPARSYSLFGPLLLFAVACSVQKPAVRDAQRMLASYSHQGVTTCNECHASARPTGVVGTPSFDHAANGGTGDCSACHLARPENLGKSWAGGAFGHVIQGATVTSCASCHLSERPSAPITANDATGHLLTNFDHITQGTGDCAGCHQAALSNIMASPPIRSWAQTGLLYPVTLAAITAPDQGSTDASVSVSTPTWNGTSITAIVTSSLAIPQPMNHQSIEVTGIAQNCALCHTGASSGSYRPGYYHSNLTTQPRTCADCHGAGTLYSTGAPTNGMPLGFVGTPGNARNPASPEMNHFAQNWTLQPGPTGGWVHNGTPAYTQDCVLCHTSPGSSWSSANFHSSLSTNGKAQPTSCLDCHANNRPSGAVPSTPAIATPTRFNHSSDLGDCVSCHAAPTVTNTASPPSASLWANGVFHSGSKTLSSCSSCHESQRPSNTSGWAGLNANAPFDYTTHGGASDCATCHSKTTNFALMTGWSGGFYAHPSTLTTCNGCHTVPTTSWYPNAASITFDHTGTGDCIGCHAQALTNVINQANTPTNAAWVGTGVGGTPTGLVGNRSITVAQISLQPSSTITSYRQVSSTTSVNATLPLNFLHSSSMIPSTHFSGGALVCTNCHSAASVASGYKNGLFHTNPATGTLWATQPAQCKDCHQATMPTGIVGSSLRYLNHAALMTNGQTVANSAPDCSTCHTQAGVSGGWLSGGYFHGKIAGSNPKVCSDCHYSEVQPILSTITNRMNHSSSQVTQDCATCHAQPTAPQIATGGYPNLSPSIWSGGKFHSVLSTQPSACNDCHSNERPASTTQSTIDATSPTLQYMNHASSWAQGDCAVCHLNEVRNLTAGTSPTAWLRSDSFHTGVSSGVTSCKECHGLSNGSTVAGTGNTIPAGITASSTTSSLGNAGTTVTPYFNSPGTGMPIIDQMNHLDANVSGKDCVSCHVTPAANAGPAYAVWKNAKFHLNVPSVDTVNGKCVNCHFNIMPDSTFASYNHTLLISGSGTVAVPGSASKLIQDCGSCHASNIGTNWTGAAVSHNSTFLKSTTSCVVCHTSGGPTSYAAGGNVITGTAVGMPTTQTNMNITTVANGRTYSYTLSFKHVNTATSYSGFTTKAFDLSATNCLYCHGIAANAIVVTSGNNTISSVPPTGATGWKNGHMGGILRSGTTYNHTLGPTSFTYTAGSTAPISASVGGSTVSACVVCHYPLYQAARSAGRHDPVTLDCNKCHSPANTDWKNN